MPDAACVSEIGAGAGVGASGNVERLSGTGTGAGARTWMDSGAVRGSGADIGAARGRVFVLICASGGGERDVGAKVG